MLSSSLEQVEKNVFMPKKQEETGKYQKGARNASPVVVLDPHEDVIHPLPAHRRRVGHEGPHSSQQLLQLDRSQLDQDLVDDVQANPLPGFVPGGRYRPVNKKERRQQAVLWWC